MGGRDAEPLLVSLRGGYVPSTAPKSELRLTKKTNVLDKKGKSSQNVEALSVIILLVIGFALLIIFLYSELELNSLTIIYLFCLLISVGRYS